MIAQVWKHVAENTNVKNTYIIYRAEKKTRTTNYDMRLTLGTQAKIALRE